MPESMAGSQGDGIRFILDGKVLTVDDVDPTQSVLGFLRERSGTHGHEGRLRRRRLRSLHGGGRASSRATTSRLQAVNACIQFVPALDGKALFTVEDLRQPDGALHPAQQAMVECHGSQCGFCTPGFVMSLWALYLEHQALQTRPTDGEIRSALTGNLCRCTGYRPILDAAARMFDLAAGVLRPRRAAPAAAIDPAGPFARPRARRSRVLRAAIGGGIDRVAGKPSAGDDSRRQHRHRPVGDQAAARARGDHLHRAASTSSRTIRESDGALRIGAGATLTEAYRALARHYPEIREMWERFASPPIRNAGTMGGNVANGSPIGDSMPGLIALGATVTLRNSEGSRTLPMEDLYIGYMKKAMAADEILEAIDGPAAEAGAALSDLQGFEALRLRHLGRLRRVRDRARRGTASSAAAWPSAAWRRRRSALPPPSRRSSASAGPRPPRGRQWLPSTPTTRRLTDMRASAAYRTATARNLLYRFFLETRPDNPLPAAAVSVFAAGMMNARGVR